MQRPIVHVRALALIASLGTLASLVVASPARGQDDWQTAVTSLAEATPRATCGPGSHPETGIQGRVPLADHLSGRAAQPYTCNTEPVAQVGTTGGFQVHRFIDETGRECAYYDSTLYIPRDVVRGAEPGVRVLDMSDPTAPEQTAILRTPAMASPHESLRLHAGRGLLVANMGYPTTSAGFVDVYDVSSDCRYPVLRSSLPLAVAGHEGGFSPDGLTYWATTTATNGITAIDVSDPDLPRIVWRSQEHAVHGLSLSPDGRRAYLARVSDFVTTTSQGGGGLTILDVSEIQDRVPDPQVTVIAARDWPEVSIPQNLLETTIGGVRYLIEFDEFDSNVYGNDPADLVGGVRIFDLTDPADPVLVSRIRLEVQQQEARATDQQDDPGNQAVGQGYAAHYCSIPRSEDPGILACSMIASGLRVFDIRDPAHPVEVAYFNKALVRGTEPSTDGAYAMSAPAFAPERDEIWYSDVNTGFHVVRLTNGAWVS